MLQYTMKNDLITIATFNLPHEAHILKAELEAQHIPVFITDEHTANIHNVYNIAIGGIKVQVPPAYAQTVQQYLQHQNPQCPRCNNTFLIELHRSLGNTLLILIFMLGIPLFFTQQKYRCRSCGLTFKKN